MGGAPDAVTEICLTITSNGLPASDPERLELVFVCFGEWDEEGALECASAVQYGINYALCRAEAHILPLLVHSFPHLTEKLLTKPTPPSSTSYDTSSSCRTMDDHEVENGFSTSSSSDSRNSSRPQTAADESRSSSRPHTADMHTRTSSSTSRSAVPASSSSSSSSVSAVLVKLSPVIMKPRVLNVRSKATAIPSWVVHVQSKDVSLTAWQQAQLQLQSQQQQQQH